MAQESLRELLARVHERLGASSSVDRESRQLLGTVMRDIERALGADAASAGSQSGQAAAGHAAAAHAPRLDKLAVKFEAGHPGLAEVLRELVDALGKAGI
jgi:predicted component of type VI protein secretion system